MIGKTRHLDTRHHSVIRNILFLSLSCFCLAILLVAFHHHDSAFRLRACSICKVKSSVSGTINKQQIDPTPAVAAIDVVPAAILLGLSGIAPNPTSDITHFPTVITFPNKAPPVRS
jgi:hypothetical protein